jgi:uroporphyrinogen III methyltransferase/synthase
VTVYLVGAGPGDPGLLTVRGREVLARADVVVYDRLSVASLLDLAPAHAERVSVGKTPRGPSVPQAEINALLVEKGKAGLEVVRLKGGDPFVFARGGEEAAALAEAGVPFEVVPGVTSAIAVPAYAGIPVTHRGLATSFTVVTGHEDPWAASETDWEAVARMGRTGGTIVVLMGVATRAAIAERLLAGGMAPTTPVAAVRWGTRPDQETRRTTLAELGAIPLEAPATIVIGPVAALELAWFETRPLFGRRVVVTRAAGQAGELVARLRELGAEAVEVPAIEIVDPDDGGAALRAAAARVHTYDWVVFTSANAVVRLCAELRDARAFGRARIAAIGPGTADALAARNLVADLVPDRFVAEGLLASFPEAGPAGGRVLLPRAAVARDVLPAGLRAKGWDVDVVVAYRTVAARPSPAAIAAAREADAICFTSSSTVTNYLAGAGREAVPPLVACIGPVTAETARAAGLTVDVVAEVHTTAGLLDALVAAFAERARRTATAGAGP